MVRTVIDAYQIGERRVCKVFNFHRSLIRYQSIAPDQAPLRARIRELAADRPRYGYQRIYILLRREGWHVNHKRVLRLYRLEGLSLRSKRPKRHVSASNRIARAVATDLNESWSMDFVTDALFNGRRFRVLTIVDNFSRESLGMLVDRKITGEMVSTFLTTLGYHRGAPGSIRVDNGPEFISKALDKWAYDRKVSLDFSRPGKPTDNAFIESFNGSFRDECLNANWFLSFDDARRKIEIWWKDYNEFRPHSALGNKTPNEFALGAKRRQLASSKTQKIA